MSRFTPALLMVVLSTCSPASRSIPPGRAVASKSVAIQQTTTELINAVSPSVVQIMIVISGQTGPTPVLPRELQDCFADDAGDVITASHVAQDVQKAIQLLAQAGVRAQVTIGVKMPNVETEHLIIHSGTAGFPAVLLSIDPIHDLAAYRTLNNPLNGIRPMIGDDKGTDLAPTKATAAHIAKSRAQDGEAIVACGYPFGEPGLVTTSGTIASAWKSDMLMTSQIVGKPTSIETYWVDLRVNPGNSGGPIFRMEDRSVLGVVVELHGSMGIAVPAKYITEFSHNLAAQTTPTQR